MSVRVIVALDIIGGVEFTSPPMEPHQADILLMELSRGPVRVIRARRTTPDEVAPGANSESTTWNPPSIPTSSAT